VLIPAILAGIGTLVPIVYLVLRAFEADPATVQRLVLRERTWTLMVNTSRSRRASGAGDRDGRAAGVAHGALRPALEALVTILAVVPLAIPGYVVAYALISLGGNERLPEPAPGYPVPRPSGYWGAVAALSALHLPVPVPERARRPARPRPEPRGERPQPRPRRPRSVVWRVVLPQLRPALLAGWLVIALYVLGDFGVVALMRFEAFSTRSTCSTPRPSTARTRPGSRSSCWADAR
jgi:iron(III) transport system permease protein